MAAEKNKSTKKQKKSSIYSKLYNLLVAVLLLGISWNIFLIYKEFSAHGKNALGDGRKLIYNVITNEIQLADLQNKQEILEKGDAARLLERDKQQQESGPNKNNDGTSPSTQSTPLTPEQLAAQGEEGAAEGSATTGASQNYSVANLGVIITNLGLRQTNLDIAKTFPKEVAFAFSPYSRELQNKIRMSRNEGREILLGVEFESSNYPLTDSGPYTVHAFFEANQNIYRVQTTLALADNYLGVIAPYDEIITSKRESIIPVVEYLKSKNLFLAYVKTSKNSELEHNVKPVAANILIIDYYIDEDMGPDEIREVLRDVKEDLLSDKRVVLAITPYSAHLGEMKEWLKANLNPKIQLAPISKFVTRN
jgi:polysaccharide deacetylase 2 family uncharacterized protein YibQ